VQPQFVRLVGEQSERRDEGLGHPRERCVEDVHDAVALEADHLAVEPVEEDGVPGLVLDLRGDVELLLLAGADHEHRQLDLDLPLAVVEAGRDGDERLPLLLGHLLFPVDLVLGEVEVVDVPALLEVLAVQRGEVRQRPQVLVHVLDDVVDVDVQHGLEFGFLDLADLFVAQRTGAFPEYRGRALAFGHAGPSVVSRRQS
jgi:hypothetical protein